VRGSWPSDGDERQEARQEARPQLRLLSFLVFALNFPAVSDDKVAWHGTLVVVELHLEADMRQSMPAAPHTCRTHPPPSSQGVHATSRRVR
jgi:hypothetical protein